jgi:hypothetical protein
VARRPAGGPFVISFVIVLAYNSTEIVIISCPFYLCPSSFSSASEITSSRMHTVTKFFSQNKQRNHPEIFPSSPSIHLLSNPSCTRRRCPLSTSRSFLLLLLSGNDAFPLSRRRRHRKPLQSLAHLARLLLRHWTNTSSSCRRPVVPGDRRTRRRATPTRRSSTTRSPVIKSRLHVTVWQTATRRMLKVAVG